MSKSRGPNPISVALAVRRARRVAPPNPAGVEVVDHDGFAAVLDALVGDGIQALPGQREALHHYRDALAAVDPDRTDRASSLAYWLNLYNAGALDLAAEATALSTRSVLRVPGAFDRTWARVGDEQLSLTDIEHGKIRRFGDPRIHGALVCGTASCPTLRFEPYFGPKLEAQLDDQLRSFMDAGGVAADKARNKLMLSRIFLWYGADFTRPDKMPAWRPPRKVSLTRALAPWFDAETEAWAAATRPRVAYRPYNWELACAVM